MRELSGVFHSLDALDGAIGALLRAGFDRADIDIMADIDEITAKLRTGSLSAAELADSPSTLRRPLIRPEDVVLVVSCVAGIVGFLGAAAVALFVVASGGPTEGAVIAALIAGVAAGGPAAYFAYSYFGRGQNTQMRSLVAAGGVVLWVRVRSSEDEAKALAIFSQNGAVAQRSHEIEIQKRLQDLPLSSIRAGPVVGNASSRRHRALMSSLIRDRR